MTKPTLRIDVPLTQCEIDEILAVLNSTKVSNKDGLLRLIEKFDLANHYIDSDNERNNLIKKRKAREKDLDDRIDELNRLKAKLYSKLEEL